MTTLSVLATVVGTIGAMAGVPQIIKIHKRKSAGDISVLTYLIAVTAGFVWILYGLELGNFAMILSSTLGVVTSVVILVQYSYYGRSKK